ncbi:MAG TPA: hypothetical protein VEI06_12680 [Gemmatimonadaceae bacterium]|nr:hypothetical protein [Gemmatimonadaceae bacterium]
MSPDASASPAGADPRAAAPAGRIPIVFGVTGHRDISPDDFPRLDAAVRKLLDLLRGRCKATPFLLITPLAPGADRLVARAVIESGGELVVALPFAPEEYEKDFPDSVKEFRELLAHERTVRRLVMPTVDPPPSATEPSARRALQYALAGAYVARHSQVLIALWDGRDAEGVGGTAHVVRYRRTGQFYFEDDLTASLAKPPNPFGLTATPLDPHDTGPVYHIVTPRVKHPAPDNPFSPHWLVGEQAMLAPVEPEDLPHGLETSLKRLEEFNGDAVKISASHADAVAASETSLYDATGTPVPGVVRGLRNAFGLADALAVDYQRNTFSVLGLIYVMAFFAVICFESYGHLFPPDDPKTAGLLGGYVLILLVAYLVNTWAKRRRFQNKFQDYRAVAEGLRVLFYWRLAGLQQSGADFYLRKQKDELAWIREAVRAWGVRADPVVPADVVSLGSRWITSERDYFTHAAQRERARLTKYRSIAGGVILASLIWAVPTITGGFHVGDDARAHWRWVMDLSLLVLSALVAWFLAFEGSLVHGGKARRSVKVWLTTMRPFLITTAIGAAFMFGMVRLAPLAHARWPALPSEAHAWVVVALGLITVIGALVHTYTEKRAFDEHSHQYTRMAEIFNRASDRMTGLLHDGRTGSAGELAVELGKEALAEHGDWIMLHRERPIELPKVEV